MIKENKIPEAEVRKIQRSQITLAEYNPRTIKDDAKKRLEKNVKKKLYGGIVWNERTGNLVSGHQRVDVADKANKYNSETRENDYWITVIVADLSEKEEKEQNLFFNSKAAMGDYDYKKLALMYPDIDSALAGLDDVDISMIEIELPEPIEIEIPSFEPQADKAEKAALEREQDNSKYTPAKSANDMTEEERIAHVKAIKEKVKQGATVEGDSYFTVSFDSYDNKVFFLERFGIDADCRFIKGEEMAEKLDEMYES